MAGLSQTRSTHHVRTGDCPASASLPIYSGSGIIEICKVEGEETHLLQLIAESSSCPSPSFPLATQDERQLCLTSKQHSGYIFSTSSCPYQGAAVLWDPPKRMFEGVKFTWSTHVFVLIAIFIRSWSSARLIAVFGHPLPPDAQAKRKFRIQPVIFVIQVAWKLF